MESAVNLTGKQKKFCENYIWDFNGARAAREAGYSDDSAASIASELLTKPNIQGYIKELEADLAKNAGISRLMVVSEFKKLAFSSIAHMHNTWITRKEFEELTEDQKAAIQEISTKVTTEKDAYGNPKSYEWIKVKLYDKGRALESINKMLGYHEPEKIAITGETQVIKIGGQDIAFE